MKNLLIVVVATLVWCLPLEFLSRLLVRSRGDGLQRARQILVRDPALGWRQRTGLSTRFEGQVVRTGKNGFRDEPDSLAGTNLVVLGPSSAFGWGVAGDETYASRLALPTRRALNAGEIGFTTYQGMRLYDELKESPEKISPRYVVLAYGINDLDRFRFYSPSSGEDAAVLPRAGNPPRFVRWLEASAFGSLLLRGWEELSLYRDCGFPGPAGVRVPIPQALDNISRIARRIRRDGGEPILLDTAFHVSTFPEGGRAERADRLFRESVDASRLGHCAESREKYREARSYDIDRVARDVARFNRGLSHLARAEKYLFVDVSGLLEKGSPKENFVDPVHPSSLGHAMIAREIEKILSR